MNYSQRIALAELPANDQRWLCVVGRAPDWIQHSIYHQPWRPAICFVVDLQTDLVLHFGLGERKDTLARLASRTLVEAMTAVDLHKNPEFRTASDSLKPGRPASIEFTHEAVQLKLQKDLKVLGIRSTCVPHVARIQALMQEMAGISGQKVEPGVLTQLQGDISSLRRYFAAAASIHDAAPWQFLADNHVIEVRYPPTAEPFWVSLTGIDDEQCSLTIYDSLDVVNYAFAKNAPRLSRADDHQVCMLVFGAPFEYTYFEDLDLIEQFDFPVDGYEAFPMICRVRVEDDARLRLPSTVQDVERVIALAQALPEFVTSEVNMAAQEDEYPKPADATLMLPEGDPHGSIRLTFPPAGLTFRPPMYADPRDDDFDLDDSDLD